MASGGPDSRKRRSPSRAPTTEPASEHGKDFSIVQFPDGNHPLMQSVMGGRGERRAPSQFVPGMFTTIETWLEKRGFMP